jgi:hypothetical protein
MVILPPLRIDQITGRRRARCDHGRHPARIGSVDPLGNGLQPPCFAEPLLTLERRSGGPADVLPANSRDQKQRTLVEGD